MFKIINIQEINNKYSRELGNKVITTISNIIKENISEDYIFVRYMGPKFVIAFSGVDTNSVGGFLNDIKEKIENTQIGLNEEEIAKFNLDAKFKNTKLASQKVKPILNFAISSYYKGTGLEEVLKKLEEYLDHAPEDESDITNI